MGAFPLTGESVPRSLPLCSSKQFKSPDEQGGDDPVGNDIPAPKDTLESWLLHRVAQVVEAGEVSADLLADLQAEFETARERPQGEAHAAAIQHIADLGGVPEEEAAGTLAAMEAQPTVTRELLMRRFAEAWLAGHREAYRTRNRGE